MKIIQNIGGNKISIIGSNRFISIYNYIAKQISESLGRMKTLMTYRNASDGSSTTVLYNICSGNTAGTDITLYQEGVEYGYTLKDDKNRIWVNWILRHEDNAHFAPVLIYTYPNSCNSWKGGWDYWYTPNGVCFASGHATLKTDVGNTTGELTKAVCANYNLGPYPTTPINYSATPGSFCATPSNDVILSAFSSNKNDVYKKYSVGLWYLSSNKGTYGTWYHTYSLSGNHDSIPLIQRTPTSVVAIMHSSNVLVGMKSTDWGRTWGQHSSLRTCADLGPTTTNVGLGNGYQYFRGLNEPSTDEYVRFICTHFSGNSGVGLGVYYGCAASSQSRIMKLNVNTMQIELDLAGSEYGSGAACFFHLIGNGEKYGDICIWAYPVGEGAGTDGKTPGGNDNGSCGDARHVFWLNESNNTCGYEKFDTSTGYIWQSHTGGACRYSKNGQILGCAASYFGAPEGGNAATGEFCKPDIMSGNTSDPTTCVWSEKNADVYSGDGGACGSSFEILENR